MNATDSSWRYERNGKARSYAQRSQRRHRRELSLLRAVLGRVEEAGPLGRVLDAPCGAGRFCEEFARRGAEWHGADASPSMLEEARLRLGDSARLVEGRIDALDFGDKSFDHVLCFRFLHHVPADEQRALLTSLARIAGRGLLISGFHPVSTHEWSRRTARVLFRKERHRFPTWPRCVDEMLRPLGFERLVVAREGILRDLWLGAWLRSRS